jgi:hypothetical protein
MADSQQKESRITSPVGVAFFAAVLLFVVGNALTGELFVTQQTLAKEIDLTETVAVEKRKPWSWWLCKAYMGEHPAPDVVLFGSSQVGSALVTADAQTDFKVVDALTHRRASTLQKELLKQTGQEISVFSLSAPGQMISDAYMLSRVLLKPGHQPKLVVFGVAPRDFIDNTMTCAASTEPYKFLTKFETPGNLSWMAYEGDFWSRMQCFVDGMPMKRFGTDLMSTFASAAEEQRPATEKKNNNPLSAISGAEAIPGAWKVPANIPRTLWIDNTKEYKHRFKNYNPPLYAGQMQFFKEFLTEMRSQGIKVLVVGMPTMPMNRELLPQKFWTKFRTAVASACEENGASWLDLTADGNFQKSDYLDTVHLNAYGGIKLFNTIAREVNARPSLAGSLKRTTLAGNSQAK